MLVCVDLPERGAKNLIDRSLRSALTGYQYDSLWQIVRRPTATKQGSLWEFFMLDAAISRQARQQWLVALERGDRLVTSRTFKRTLPQYACARRWLEVVYRLAWESELIGCKPIARYFDFESGCSQDAVLRGLNEWAAWLASRIELPSGGHLLFLPDDIRRCSSLAIDALSPAATTESYLAQSPDIRGGIS